MPLPTGNVAWPPEDTRRPRELYETWGAWYTGDPDELAAVYGGGIGAGRGFYEDPHRGVIGRAITRVARWFWGQAPTPGQAPTRLHVPLASDIAEASAQLLFEELPAITVDQAQDRLDAIVDEAGLHATLLEGAEICAAYGGVYLRVSWDTEVAGVPLVDAITPDTAAPEWRRGMLSAVTFWRVVADDHGRIWRHLERHEPGRVLHGLYEGARDRLGRPVPLADHPDTAGLAKQVDADGAIPTGHERLAVVYVPNIRPNRSLRGSPLGRADIAGVEPLMDQLDEVWSSWGREHRLAVARAIVPRYLLQDLGAGAGARFDELREFFTGVDIPPTTDATTSQLVQMMQPDIRVEEHARTCEALATQVIRGAGYSASTFGEDGGQAVTATEVRARQRRTYQTRARKIGYWRPQLVSLVEALLAVDASVFPGAGAVAERPVVEWPDDVAPDPEALSRTLVSIATAEAASVRTRVRMLHPDWDEAAVAEEVERIRADRVGEADPWASGAELAGNLLDDRDQGDRVED
ncbi:phage portal protein [Nocardiopsis rhodophaea]|uniref:phage portal protein n=1 Tax=Nocardiopsis rhodophaea TaxID=280238 RepID=UPI0031E387D2